jgi:L,D-transpeptidase YcbB
MRHVLIYAFAATLAACSGSRIDDTALGLSIEQRVSAIHGDGVAAGGTRELGELYAPSGHAPLWLDGKKRPSRQALDVLALLQDAAAEGLDPRDYDAAALEAQAGRLADGKTEDPEEVAGFDVDLSLNVIRFLRHVHAGRIDPRDVGFEWTVPVDADGFAPLVAAAAADGRVDEMVARARPALPVYEPLRQKLAEYRARSLEARPRSAFPEVSRAVNPGDRYAGLDTLARHLIAAGDLREDAALPAGDEYGEPLVEAVKRFQARHGLPAEGVLGPATIEALSVPLSWRVRQIELALERLRWVPHAAEGRVIFVNIPMFHLWSWDRMSAAAAPVADMDIIVGRALETATPVFSGDLSYVVFRPYWNIPPSIATDEILPAIEKDPSYLRRQNMEIVQGASDDGALPVEATRDNLQLLREGKLRVRQRPGPQNALGLVKFMFPNEHNVYLHSTPAPELFDRARRDFSHGCVRVADPVALGAWIMNEQEWTPSQVEAAMTSGADSRVVNLAEPVQVILTYVTAMVWPEDGSMRFAADIYKHDGRLDEALARRH